MISARDGRDALDEPEQRVEPKWLLHRLAIEIRRVRCAGEHDDRDVCERRRSLHRQEERPPVHLGHQHVEDGDGAELMGRVRAAEGEITVVAPEATLQALVLDLVGRHEGTDSIRFLPGALSQVQFLRDRAVVRHLNVGRAV